MSAVRVERVRSVGEFDVSLRWGKDWDMWMRVVLDGGQVGLVPKPLAHYRMHGAQLSAQRSPLDRSPREDPREGPRIGHVVRGGANSRRRKRSPPRGRASPCCARSMPARGRTGSRLHETVASAAARGLSVLSA